MASVHGVACDMVKGDSLALGTRLDLWQVPGIDGYGALDLGLGDSAFRFTAIEYNSLAAIETWIALLEAKRGVVGTIVDDFGTSHTYCLILRVSLPRRRKNQADYRGEVTVEGVITA